MQLYTPLQPYADAYDMDLYHDFNEEVLLERLEEDAQAYREYLTARGQVENLREQVQAWNRDIADFLAAYPVTGESRHECLAQIRRRMDRFSDLDQKVAELKAELAREMADLPAGATDESVEQLQEEQKELDAQIADMTQSIHSLRDDLAGLSEELEGYEEAREEVRELRREE